MDLNKSTIDFFPLSESGRNPGFWKEVYTEDDREHLFSMGQSPYPYKKQSHKQFGGRGASQATSRPMANRNPVSSSQDRREKPGRGEGRLNSKSPGMNAPYGIDIAP